jgi:hypothetical protein
MPNPYTIIFTDLTTENAAILAAWSEARGALVTQGAPETYFLEINFTGTRIKRTFDDVEVVALSASEQYRLYPQLNGLFNLAMRNLFYP